MKNYCGKPFGGPDPLQPMFPKYRCEEGTQCPECEKKDETPPEPTPFEVLNANGVPLIRHKSALINMNNIVTIEKYGVNLRFVSAGTDVYTNLQFNDEAEVEAAFDAIMGGNKATPTSKELKDNQAKNKAIEKNQIVNL